MTIRGFTNSPLLPPLPSFSERDMANSKSPLKTGLPLPSVTLLLHVAFGQFCNPVVRQKHVRTCCHVRWRSLSGTKSKHSRRRVLPNLSQMALAKAGQTCVTPRDAFNGSGITNRVMQLNELLA